MAKDIARLYSSLLDNYYQETLFGSFKGFQKKSDCCVSFCPYHDDELPTLLINVSRPEYFCYVCGARGDWISFLMGAMNHSYKDSLESLNKAAGMKVYIPEERWREEFELSMMLEKATISYASMLWTEEGRQAHEYLLRRGYMNQEIEKMGIGFFKRSNETISATNQEAAEIFSGAVGNSLITIPYRDACGRLMAIYSRGIESKGYIPLTSTDYIEDTPFLYYKSRKEEHLVVVDGFFDSLIADCIGIKGIIGTGSEGLNERMVETLGFSSAKKIVLAMSSSELNASAMKLLDGTSFEVSVVSLPEKYADVDAYIRDTCISKFGKLVEEALPAWEWLKNNLVA